MNSLARLEPESTKLHPLTKKRGVLGSLMHARRSEILRRELLAYDAWHKEVSSSEISPEDTLEYLSSLPLLSQIISWHLARTGDDQRMVAESLAFANARAAVELIKDRYTFVNILAATLKAIILLIVMAWAGQWVAVKYQDYAFVKHAEFNAKTKTFEGGLERATRLQLDATNLFGMLLNFESTGRPVADEHLRLVAELEAASATIMNDAATFEESTSVRETAGSISDTLEKYRLCLEKRRQNAKDFVAEKSCFEKNISLGDFDRLITAHNDALRAIYRKAAGS